MKYRWGEQLSSLIMKVLLLLFWLLCSRSIFSSSRRRRHRRRRLFVYSRRTYYFNVNELPLLIAIADSNLWIVARCYSFLLLQSEPKKPKSKQAQQRQKKTTAEMKSKKTECNNWHKNQRIDRRKQLNTHPHNWQPLLSIILQYWLKLCIFLL